MGVIHCNNSPTVLGSLLGPFFWGNSRMMILDQLRTEGFLEDVPMFCILVCWGRRESSGPLVRAARAEATLPNPISLNLEYNS